MIYWALCSKPFTKLSCWHLSYQCKEMQMTPAFHYVLIWLPEFGDRWISHPQGLPRNHVLEWFPWSAGELVGLISFPRTSSHLLRWILLVGPHDNLLQPAWAPEPLNPSCLTQRNIPGCSLELSVSPNLDPNFRVLSRTGRLFPHPCMTAGQRHRSGSGREQEI